MASGLLNLGFVVPPSFLGDPNEIISAINTSGGIALSRASALTPAVIHADASLITATGTSVPWERLEYSWNFGDPTGTETITDPTTGLTVNLNDCQTGPAAGYCYRAPGNWVITLTIRAWTGFGNAPIVATVQATVTVTAFTPTSEFWVDFSAAGGGSGTIGSPFNSTAQVNANLANNTRFNFKRGTSTAGSTGLDLTTASYTGVRFQDYGAGALPLIAVNGSTPPFHIGNGGGSTLRPQNDIVLTNLNLQTAAGWFISGGGGIIQIDSGSSNVSSTVKNIYADTCSLINTVDPGGTAQANPCTVFDTGTSMNPPQVFNIGAYRCTIQNPLTAGLTNNCRQLIGGGPAAWFMALGNTGSGSGTDDTHDHHFYLHVQYHCLISLNNLGATATASNPPTKNFGIKMAYDGAGDSGDGTFYAKWWCVSRNFISGTHRSVNASNLNNDPTLTRVQGYVCQQNVMANLDGGASGGSGSGAVCLLNTPETATMRDNIAYGCQYDWWEPTPNANAHFSIYRNWIYTVNAHGQPSINFYQSGWTNKNTITDNIIHSTEVSLFMANVVFADFATGGSAIDRNNYFAPNLSGNEFLNGNGSTPTGGTAMSLATWRGTWDQNTNKITGSNSANPGWPSPATGNFGTWPRGS